MRVRHLMSRGITVMLAMIVVIATGTPIEVAAADPTGDIRTRPRWWLDPEAAPRYESPHPGAVLRGFEPPGTTFGPGHRGLDLDAAAHSTVRAAAGGRVIFAGPVAGVRWVAIFHPDGVITSYGPLARLTVAPGDAVDRAQPIGTVASGGHGAGGRDRGLHWGARIDGRYLDPRSLLSEGLPRPSLIGEGGWRGIDHAVLPYEPWAGGRFGGLLTASSPVADRPGFAVAPNPNHLVLVAGLASTSGTVVLDADHLGYDPRSVTRFSYAGRQPGRGRDDDPRRDQRRQGPEDTWAGTERAAERLAGQLRAQARREPGRAVDLVGHSMGGVVILRYLVEHHDPYDRSLPPIGNVVTIASPLDGSDLSAIGHRLRRTPLLGAAIGRLQDAGRLGGDRLRLDAPAVGELSVGSEMLWDLAVGWEEALEAGTAGALATGTRVLNIGGSRDLVVSSARTRQPDTFGHAGTPPDLGAQVIEGTEVRLPPGIATVNGPTATVDGDIVVEHRVLPGGHHGVLETEAVREVTWRFLTGEEVTASPGHASRLIGGDVQDSARLAVELYTGLGPIPRVLRDPRRAVPVEFP